MAMLPGSRETGSALGASLLSRMSMKRLHQAVWIFEVLLPFRRSDSVRRGEAQRVLKEMPPRAGESLNSKGRRRLHLESVK